MNHDIAHCNGQAVREVRPTVGQPFVAKSDCPLRIRCRRHTATKDPDMPKVVTWVDTPEFVDGTCPVFWEEEGDGQ